MGLFEHWPYVNFHDLNLDWIIKEIPKVFASRDEAQASAEASALSAASSQLSADASQQSANDSQQSADDSQQSAEASAASEASAKNYADHIADPVAGLVTGWLEDNITPTTPAVDSSLTISGAAADAKVTGDEITDLKSVLNVINPLLEDYIKTEQQTNVTTNSMTWSSQYYNLETGELASAPGYSHTEKFSCEAGDVIEIGLNTGQVLFWGSNGYLSYVATSPSTATQITAPTGATEYACNNRDTEYRPNETTVSKTVTVKTLISHSYDAPAQIDYDSSDFTNKQYASTVNGALYTGDSYSQWYCAYKVPCEANHKYRTTIQTQVCFYSENGAFLGSHVPTIDGAQCTGVEVEMDFTTPSGCKFFSVNSYNDKEIVFDMEYEEYGDSKSAYPLIGKTVVCFGDSITGNYYFGDNYPYQIEEKTGAKIYDVGFGGCRMELTNASSINYINPFSMVSIADAIASDATTKWDTQDANVSSFADRAMTRLRLDILKSIDFSKVDIVTIAYGTNGLEDSTDDPENELNTYTFAGAARYAVKTLLTKYPHLRIVLLTPVYKWYSATADDGDTHVVNGNTLLQRVNKLLEVGDECKLPTIDLYHSLGINKYNYASYFGDDDETSDGTHINSFGRERMGVRIAGELTRLF